MIILAVALIVTTPIVYMLLRLSLVSDWGALLALAGATTWVWAWLTLAGI